MLILALKAEMGGGRRYHTCSTQNSPKSLEFVFYIAASQRQVLDNVHLHVAAAFVTKDLGRCYAEARSAFSDVPAA